MNCMLLLNTKEDILKNVDNQTVDGHQMNTMEVNGVHELSGCRHSSKYIPLCSAEERKSYRYETT